MKRTPGTVVGRSSLLRSGRTRLIAVLCLGLAGAPQALAAGEDMDTIRSFLTLMDSYYGLLADVHEVAESPQRTAIMHMQKLREIHEDRGDMAAAADALENVLERSGDPVVRNAARMMLIDVLRDTGRASEAIRVIEAGLAENIGAR